jgi:hydrogenase expression/formation protein HypC
VCLAVPYTVKEIFSDGFARASSGGLELDIRVDLIENPNIGDTVLVHAGFAIQKLVAGESEELASLWDEINKAEFASKTEPARVYA